jgi:uroporphyrinogen-III synthase
MQMVAAYITMILTRPVDSNDRFVAALSDEVRARLRLIESPLIEITAMGTADISANEEVIFTSANGVRFAPPGADRVAYCVGNHTTQAAQAAGWAAQQRGFDATSLIADLLAHPPTASLVHISGRHTRGDVVETLTAAGLRARRIAVYDQRLAPLAPEAIAALSGSGHCIVPVFSPRMAHHFAALCPQENRVLVAAISEAVAESFGSWRPAELCVSATPDIVGMAECVEKLLSGISLG